MRRTLDSEQQIASPGGLAAVLARLAPPAGSKPFGIACLAGAATFVVLAEIIRSVPANVMRLTARFFFDDQPWMVALSLVLLVVALGAPAKLSIVFDRLVQHLRRSTAALAVFVFAIALIGTFVIYRNYGLSRDEAMAAFDASILTHGRMIATLPAQWRAYTQALEPTFLLPIQGGVGWVSSYLPINAAIRAAFALAASPVLAGPTLAATALLALVGVARRLWPDRPDAALVAALILAASCQVLFTAMTPYAMTAHLAFNLVWLWLFLGDTKADHAGAIAIGFFATGLHQLAFHPLFAMPFVAGLWLQRRYALATLYTLAYAAIVGFWISYWPLLLHLNGMTGAASLEPGSFVGKVLDLVRGRNADDVEIMLMNLARFVTWQTPLLLPLLFVAIWGARRWNATHVALAAGIIATITLVSAVLPFQGHGWGYRYLHGLIGSFALLAAQGYVTLTENRSDAVVSRLRAQIVLGTAFALFVMVPLRSQDVRSLLVPYAAATQRIEHANADVVFVDEDGMMFSRDLVRNAPDLSNRPLVLDLRQLDNEQIRALCATRDVAVFDGVDGRELQIPFETDALSGQSVSRRKLMASIGCGHPITPQPR